ncbi:MAG TPA: alanine racemase [Thermoanaerobaculia bacterium]|nr:alanine racemase [Thermoanaerobaculia bacterium]
MRPAWAVVDLDALDANIDLVRRRIGPASLLAVIKADAYGHGAIEVARRLEARKVDWLGVALIEEGAELRRAGITLPILVLGTAQEEQLPLYRRYRLTATVSSPSQMRLWLAYARGLESPQPVHVKVDTGMGRLGFSLQQAREALRELASAPGLRLSGLLSHLASADELESESNRAQEHAFNELVADLSAEERRGLLVHLANSAAALNHPWSRHSLVRVGLALLGLDPARSESGLRPILSVESRIVQTRRVPPGTRLGYGGLWTAERESVVGVVPIGYADGYTWRLTNRAQALVRGRRVAVIGAVSMDMTMLDLTDVEGETGDEVTLLGAQGEERIDAWELAESAGTIPYEILCALGLRLPRRYVAGGSDRAIDSRFRSRVP